MFKKVGEFNADGGKINYIYKAINPWGDGKWANEFYTVPRKSVIDNGFVQVEDELKVTDAQIMAYFGGTAIVKEVTPIEEENELEDVPQIEDTDWKEEDNNDTCNPF